MLCGLHGKSLRGEVMTEAEQIMKRCQAGTRNYEEANNLHAACYGIIGKLSAQLKEALAQEQEPKAWRRREVGGAWQYYGWKETGMTYEAVNRSNKNGFECEAIPATPPQRKPPTVDVRILQAVSDEYNAWIRAHAAGMGYDDFLLQRLAAHGIKENHK